MNEAVSKPARLARWVAENRFVSLLAVAVVVLGKNVAELCRDKAYALDEFFYAHRAWMALQPDDGLLSAIGRGEAFVPSAVMAPFVALGGDDPATMLYVRLSMLIWVAVCAAGVAFLAARASQPGRRLGIALAAILVLVSDPTLVQHLVEIRPDGVAAALLVAALALLGWPRISDRVAAFVAGLVVFAACMSSVKAFVVAAGLGPVFGFDLLNGRRGRPQVLRSAPMFSLGFATGAMAVLAVVVASATPAEFWQGFYERRAFHERYYTAIDLDRFLWPYIENAWPALLVAVLGIVAMAVDLCRRWRDERALDLDALVVLFWFGAWASYLLQKAAYPYSLIPIGVFTAVPAARGLAWIAAPLVGRGRMATVAGALALAGFSALTLGRVTPARTNDGQIAVQREIGRLTNPDDAAYDMSGTFVYRPRGHRFVFVDKSRRRGLRAELNREVPRSLVEREVVLFVWDLRFAASWRKTQLGRFILENYQPRSWELFFWGRQYKQKKGEPVSATFRAVKTGRYFVHPPEARSRLRINGRRPRERIVELERGEHRINIDASPDGKAVYLIWLPASGAPFNPTRHRWYGAGRKNALGRWILP